MVWQLKDSELMNTQAPKIGECGGKQFDVTTPAGGGSVEAVCGDTSAGEEKLMDYYK